MFGAVIAITKLQARVSQNCGSFVSPEIFKQYFLKGITASTSESSLGIRKFGHQRPFFTNKSNWFTKDILGCNHGRQGILSIRSSISQFFKYCTNPLKGNTNITNNVILYRYERPLVYKLGLAFGFFGMIGCLAMADVVFMVLCKNLFNSAIELKTRIIQHILPVTAVVIGVIAGPLILVAVWFLTVRSVKYAVLHKGGKVVTLVTYHPLKGEIRRTLPVNEISCTSDRDGHKGYVQIKVKNKKWHYMMDRAGHFVNPELFDKTLGMNRF